MLLIVCALIVMVTVLVIVVTSVRIIEGLMGLYAYVMMKIA